MEFCAKPKDIFVYKNFSVRLKMNIIAKIVLVKRPNSIEDSGHTVFIYIVITKRRHKWNEIRFSQLLQTFKKFSPKQQKIALLWFFKMSIDHPQKSRVKLHWKPIIISLLLHSLFCRFTLKFTEKMGESKVVKMISSSVAICNKFRSVCVSRKGNLYLSKSKHAFDMLKGKDDCPLRMKFFSNRNACVF